jgi:hypothetical protein
MCRRRVTGSGSSKTAKRRALIYAEEGPALCHTRLRDECIVIQIAAFVAWSMGPTFSRADLT